MNSCRPFALRPRIVSALFEPKRGASGAKTRPGHIGQMKMLITFWSGASEHALTARQTGRGPAEDGYVQIMGETMAGQPPCQRYGDRGSL